MTTPEGALVADNDLPPLALGKGPVRNDPRTLRLATYLDVDALPPPAATQDWLSAVTDPSGWPMYRNDEIGDCVPAGAAHQIQSWTANARHTAGTVISEADVIAAYTAIAGYDPATGANDYGCVMLDALNVWRKVGIGGHRIDAYVKIDHTDRIEVRQALGLFGGLYVGADLPTAARRQFHTGSLWKSSRGADAQPGSWGGHCIHVGRYTPRLLTCTTWGRLMDTTWTWWDTYVDEAYAIVSTDWLDDTGRSPHGLNLDALRADLHRVTRS